MDDIPVKKRILPKQKDSFIKLNNYDYSDANLDLVKNFLTTKTLNVDWTEYKKATFKNRYTPKKWKVVNDKLIYTPLNLQAVYNSDISNTLIQLYEDPKVGIGMAIRSLYNKVIDQYLGIKRKNVEEFLRGQTSYQLTRDPERVVNKPIITEYPNDRWQADLIDMGYYAEDNIIKGKPQNYILTVIDNFSKYVFAVPLPDTKALNVRDGFKTIVRKQAQDTYPKTLQTDNGIEFVNNVIKDWTKEHNIHLSRSATYQATSNALIENFNNILRKMIREGFIRNNSLNWIDHLDEYLYNRNHSKHSTTKHKPIDLWRPSRETIKENPTEPLIEASEKIKEKARRALERNKATDLKVGDKVRILLSAISSKVRKMIKEGRKKLIPVKYTTDIYTISKIAPAEEFVKKRYIVERNGQEVYTQKKNLTKPRIQLFFGTQLQKVDGESEELITTTDAETLNKILIGEEEETKPKTKSKTKPKPKPKTKLDSPETKPKTKVPPKPKPIEEESPPVRRSSRVRKEVDYRALATVGRLSK